MNDSQQLHIANQAQFYAQEFERFLEAENLTEATRAAENMFANAKLLYTWIKDKVQDEYSMEFQRAENVLSMPSSILRGKPHQES